MNTKTLFMLLLLGGSLINSHMVAAAGDHNEKHEETTEESHSDHAEKAEGHHDQLEHHEQGDEKHKDEEKQSEEEHGEHGGQGDHDEHGEEGVTKLSNAQMKAAGIVVKSLQPQFINSVIKAPGEVRFNSYKTASITPRISAQVIDRHVIDAVL